MKQRPEALDSLVPTFFSPLVLGTTVAPVASLLSWSHLRIFKSTLPGSTLNHLESLQVGPKVAEQL